MAKTHFGVVGRKGFPLDMLKKCNAFPATQLDVNEIIESYKGNRFQNEPPFVVVLQTDSVKCLPSWNKTGWLVVTVDEVVAVRRLSRI